MFSILRDELPSTLYSLMQSIVNYENTSPVKIKDLAANARSTIFNFNYPLSDNVSRETFETQILKHYLTRRINFDTLNLFQIMLDSKLNEIMPKYNLMFDSIVGWNIFKGSIENRTLKDNTKSDNTITDNKTNNKESTNINNSTSDTITNTENVINSSNTLDNRFSDLPQNRIENVKNGSYVSEYTYNEQSSQSNSDGAATSNNTNESNSISSDNIRENSVNNTKGKTIKNVTETVNRTADNQLSILIDFQMKYNNIFSLIYSELDELFYGLL